MLHTSKEFRIFVDAEGYHRVKLVGCKDEVRGSPLSVVFTPDLSTSTLPPLVKGYAALQSECLAVQELNFKVNCMLCFVVIIVFALSHAVTGTHNIVLLVVTLMLVTFLLYRLFPKRPTVLQDRRGNVVDLDRLTLTTHDGFRIRIFSGRRYGN